MQRTHRPTDAARPVRMVLAATLVVACARPACAYIDPGTGGTVLGAVAPVLAALAIFFVATLRFTWVYLAAGARFIWRVRLWSVPLLAAAVAGVLYMVLR